MSFSYAICIEVNNPQTGESEEWELAINGTEAAPARRRGHPDTWAPAEGGEIEFDTVTRAGVTKEFTDFCTEYGVDGKEVDAWMAKAEDRFAEAQADAAESYEEQRAEYLADCREDCDD